MTWIAPPREIRAAVNRELGDSFWSAFVARARRALDHSAGPGQWTVTSWYRSHATNERVGGVAASQHLVGTAFDVVVPPGRSARAVAALRAEGFAYVVDEGDHIHAQQLGSTRAVAWVPRVEAIAREGVYAYRPPPRSRA
jgi:predicted Fe-Mo cluster-binding NifX family protein